MENKRSSSMKSAYDLACERMIRPSKTKKKGKPSAIEFVTDDPRFVAPESREARGVDTISKQKHNGDIKIVEKETIHYGDDVVRKTAPEVHWSGHFLGYTGFSRMNRAFAFGLANKGLIVRAEVDSYLEHVNKATAKAIHAMEDVKISPDAPKVYGSTLPLSMNHSGMQILYTMIETSQKAHEHYIERLNLVDEVWVPTEHGKKVLENSGLRTPVLVMPLGVDSTRYHPDHDRFDFEQPLKNFVFGSVFRWSYRKGYDVLLRAYLEEFSSDDDSSLVLVSRVMDRPEEVGREKIMEDYNNIRSQIDKTDDELPHVALYDKPISEHKMPSVYCAFNSFVLMSRGEGFGLPYLEAGSCGVPVIGTNCSGHSDFLNDDNSFLVEPEGFVESNVTGALPQMAKSCRFYEGQTFPDLGNKSIQDLRRLMRFNYQNPNDARKRGYTLMKQVQSDYTWDKAVKKVHKRLLEIQ